MFVQVTAKNVGVFFMRHSVYNKHCVRSVRGLVDNLQDERSSAAAVDGVA